jgi:hypothetical protein
MQPISMPTSKPFTSVPTLRSQYTLYKPTRQASQ